MSAAVEFSITRDAAWAPGVETREAWSAWAAGEAAIGSGSEPRVAAMPAMQRRRLGLLGKMAAEVAFACLGDRDGLPIVFCSRHGEVSRSVDLLGDLARGEPLSPASFGLSVHNAIGGMLSIARSDRANHAALSAGAATVEHGVIEACGLLADGAPAVLLLAYDCPLPDMYAAYGDQQEVPFAWAWLLEPAGTDVISLTWQARTDADIAAPVQPSPAGLDILRFFLRRDRRLERVCDQHVWRWIRSA